MTDTPGGHASTTNTRIPADSFAHRLMLARAHAGHISIREAAELTGLGRGAWTHWEKGGMPLDLDYVIEVISEKLGVDPVWLLEGGALAEPEARSRRTRWSTVRPTTHERRSAGPGSQATVAKIRAAKRSGAHVVRATAKRTKRNQPHTRPGHVPHPVRIRRPVRL